MTEQSSKVSQFFVIQLKTRFPKLITLDFMGYVILIKENIEFKML